MKKKLIFQISVLLSIFIVSGCSEPFTAEIVDNKPTSNVNENHLEGKLLELSANQMLIKQDDGTETTLNLSEDTVYWEGIEWLTIFPAEIGDQILAYGEWKKGDSSFDVDQYYANRIVLKGQVIYVSGETEAYMVDQPGQDYLILPLLQKTELVPIGVDDPRSYKYFELLPRDRELIEVLGRKIDDPFVVAVRMTRYE